MNVSDDWYLHRASGGYEDLLKTHTSERTYIDVEEPVVEEEEVEQVLRF